MRLFISIIFLFATSRPLTAWAASSEQTARFDGQGTLTGPSASGSPDADSTIAATCDSNCATLAGSNAFVDCTSPKCRDSIMRGAMGEPQESQTDKKKSK